MDNKIYSINGPVVTVKDTSDFSMMEMVYVGEKRLMGEVIAIEADRTIIQVYESTTGLKPYEPVVGSGTLLSATLGPGILSNIFDGIERPLKDISEMEGAFISSGQAMASLDEKKLWDVTMLVKVGDYVSGGQIFATCPETLQITHRSMIPVYIEGEVVEAKTDGKYNVKETLVVIKDKTGKLHNVALSQKWPIKKPRPIKDRKPLSIPLITGQRVLDTTFPLAKGGCAAVPGGFGAGKTMLQHAIAKWCDADIIVYVGCGERGNEMTDVLEEFSRLVDPRTGRLLLDRTALIANTSTMPVAAREASIYTGITLAEYYRDMGYHVAVMADSTSRWAEALREISGRLEEMPAEEGFPAYLPSRIAQFYERAGYVTALSGNPGSVSIIGAVSPQGGDFSEPVTQNTKRFVRSFWALDKSLAYARHYPAVNWNLSYSEYMDNLEDWFRKNVARDYLSLRSEIIAILHDETSLMEIVKLIGSDVLPDDQKLTLEIARVIRVGFLQQNCFHPDDTYVPLEKQYKMLKVISYLNAEAKKLVAKRIPVSLIKQTGVFDLLIKMKYDIPNKNIALLDTYFEKIDALLATIV